MKHLFPIKSQTSTEDKKVLISIKDFYKKSYNYLEIGSFLGGSLPPFLNDENCKLILSIDDREKIQPDERGVSYDYKNITTKMMIDNLLSHGLNIEKLRTFDGSMNQYQENENKFDIVFIDGEHTDNACFRDFIFSFQLLKKDSICIFHDSYIVYKGIQCSLIYLDAHKISYKFIKILNSNMSIIFLGEMKNINIESKFLLEDVACFYKKAEEYRIQSIIENNLSNTKIVKIEI